MIALVVGGLHVDAAVLTLGLASGMAYGLLAVGLVLVYRSNKVINFAHGEIGAFGAALFGLAVVRWGVPYWVALPGALLASASVGAGAEMAVIRRLRNAPKLMSLVASLGLAQLLMFISLTVNSGANNGAAFPEPPGLPSWNVGSFLLTRAYVGLLLVSPVVVVALVLFLRLSRFGLAIRASAANAEAARMSGVFAARMSTLAWAIAGAVAALTAVLLKPTLGFVTSEALGPNLLLRALAAAVIARMRSLPIALAAGVGVGVLDQVLLRSYPTSGATEAVLFAVVLVALLLQTRRGGRDEERSHWSAVLPWPPLAQRLKRHPVVRRIGPASGLLLVAGLFALLTVLSNERSQTLNIVLSVSVIGLSLGVITGLGGQLSLGQYAIAGIGAVVSFHITYNTGNFLVAFLAAGAAGAAVSVLIGLPALRIKGLLLAVTTLGFAIACERFFLQQGWAFGGGVTPGRPKFGTVALDTGRSYYVFVVSVFALCLLLTRNIWRSGIGRRLRALRDNEDGARAFGVSAVRGKLEAFALAGFLAGVGGALYSHTFSHISARDFAVGPNINIVAMTVIGGIGILVGPVIGALYIIGVPTFLGSIPASGFAASSFGWLILILYFPGGIAQLVAPLRDRLIRVLAGRDADRSDEPTAAAFASTALVAAPATVARGSSDGVLLAATGLSRRFGGVRAVDGVDLEIRRGETLGLIGPNGAGKTTLFELLGGFTRADEGRILFADRDITDASPERRARLGVIRSFQDAGLFPTLTVLETVQLALERSAPTNTATALLGGRRADRRKEERARELVHLMGLDAYIDKQTSDLSTGTRRITELACVIALEPTLLLLDEPSSGVAQRETEALGELLAKVKDHLDATLVVIEHDMPLVMGMADRIVAMDSGRVIAEGTPAAIVADPVVLESYLGGGSVALERSGRRPARGAPKSRAPKARPAARVASSKTCAATTLSGDRCRRAAVVDGYCSQHAFALSGRRR